MSFVQEHQVAAFRARVAELMGAGTPFGSAVATARKESYLPAVRFGYRQKTLAELTHERSAERRWAA